MGVLFKFVASYTTEKLSGDSSDASAGRVPVSSPGCNNTGGFLVKLNQLVLLINLIQNSKNGTISLTYLSGVRYIPPGRLVQ